MFLSNIGPYISQWVSHWITAWQPALLMCRKWQNRLPLVSLCLSSLSRLNSSLFLNVLGTPLSASDVMSTAFRRFCWGTAAAAPPPFEPGNPALCGSRPLVTPYYCRLGDLLCYTCMLYLSIFLCVYAFEFCVFFVLCVVFLCSFLQYFEIREIP